MSRSSWPSPCLGSAGFSIKDELEIATCLYLLEVLDGWCPSHPLLCPYTSGFWARRGPLRYRWNNDVVHEPVALYVTHRAPDQGVCAFCHMYFLLVGHQCWFERRRAVKTEAGFRKVLKSTRKCLHLPPPLVNTSYTCQPSYKHQ